MDRDKTKMLKLTTEQIEHKFGKGSIMKLGEGGPQPEIGFIPTGALPLDAALGIGDCAAGAHRRDPRPQIVGQDHARTPHIG